jgi:hypothetical protein
VLSSLPLAAKYYVRFIAFPSGLFFRLAVWSTLFPNVNLNIGELHLDSHVFFAILTTLIVLPTTWFRDLSVLSYISGLI